MEPFLKNSHEVKLMKPYLLLMKKARIKAKVFGPMLQRERARASEGLRRKAAKVNRKLTDMMRRVSQGMKGFIKRAPHSRAEHERRDNNALRWNQACVKYLSGDLTVDEIRRRVNTELGLPHDYSPGHA